MIEQRKAERVTCQTPIEVCIGDRVFQTRTLNLSLIGVFIEEASSVAVGDRVTLRFPIPDQETIEVMGHVRRIDPGVGFGVRFDSFTARETWGLIQLLQKKR